MRSESTRREAVKALGGGAAIACLPIPAAAARPSPPCPVRVPLDAIADPSARRVNMQPRPRMGGVAIFGGMVAASGAVANGKTVILERIIKVFRMNATYFSNRNQGNNAVFGIPFLKLFRQ